MSVFAGPPVRDAIERGDADFVPIFLSDIRDRRPMDFIRGAALSKGGKPIIALPSTAAAGTSAESFLP